MEPQNLNIKVYYGCKLWLLKLLQGVKSSNGDRKTKILEIPTEGLTYELDTRKCSSQQRFGVIFFCQLIRGQLYNSLNALSMFGNI